MRIQSVALDGCSKNTKQITTIALLNDQSCLVLPKRFQEQLWHKKSLYMYMYVCKINYRHNSFYMGVLAQEITVYLIAFLKSSIKM